MIFFSFCRDWKQNQCKKPIASPYNLCLGTYTLIIINLHTTWLLWDEMFAPLPLSILQHRNVRKLLILLIFFRFWCTHTHFEQFAKRVCVFTGYFIAFLLSLFAYKFCTRDTLQYEWILLKNGNCECCFLQLLLSMCKW